MKQETVSSAAGYRGDRQEVVAWAVNAMAQAHASAAGAMAQAHA